MKILNARLGFANNSSSSHSMIIVSKKKYKHIAKSADSGDGDYGWETFTLADPESKLGYLASAIYQQLGRQGNSIAAMVVVRDLLGMPGWAPSGDGIDHQSTFELPASEDGSPVDLHFARAFASWIQSEGVVVLGGNDNDGTHALANGSDSMPFRRESSNPYVAKYDDQSQSWTLFNKSNGAKLRMAFEPGEALVMEALVGAKAKNEEGNPEFDAEPPKMGSPELVDVKITDFCDIGCGYCYQGSTPEGKHASLDSIKTLAREFFKAGVLEVAIGGGEPTRHPYFAEILEAFNTHGIVANFTTRDLSFLEDPVARARILAASKSIAVSVSSADQIIAAKEAWVQNGESEYSHPMTFQYVIGTASDEQFKKIIEKSIKESLNLTLLGYKDSGRGQTWREGEGKQIMLREAKVQNQSAAWMDEVKKAMGDKSWARVCIDTALARESEAHLNSKEIPRHLWHKSEGLVSMYVDAVSMKLGVSSYEAPEEMVPFDSKWLSVFKSWTPSADEPSRKKKGPKNGR